MIAMSYIETDNKPKRLDLSTQVAKVVVIGEPKVGKSTFIRAFWEQHEPEEIYHLNNATVYPCRITVDDIRGRMAIFEIPGDPAFGEAHRTPHYRDAHVIVWMYAIDDPVSFEILRDEWLPEAEDICNMATIPSVLVGNKKDLRNNRQVIRRLAAADRTPVTLEDGALLFVLRAIVDFSEISANALHDVNDVFDIIMYLAFRPY